MPPPEPLENLALRNNDIVAAERRLDRIRDRIDGMLDIVKRYEEMASNDDGRRVASIPEAVEKYLAIQGAIRRTDLEQLSTELDRMESAVERSRNYGERLPDEQTWQELEKAASETFVSFRDVGRMLDLLVSQSPTASTGAATLKDVLEQREEKRAADLTERLTDVRKQTKEEVEAEMKSFEQQIGDLEAEMKLMEEKAAVAEEEDRIKRLEVQHKHEGEVRKQQAEMERLRKQFQIDYPRFEKYLLPYTSDGYKQPLGPNFVQTETFGPVSYARLVGTGALIEGKGEWLFILTTVRGNDRPLGAFPPRVIADRYEERHMPTFIAIQNFLRIYGPIMVEKKYLAP